MHVLRVPATVLAVLLLITACVTRPTSYHISSTYGSVSLSADVVCEEAGSYYAIIVPDLKLTFEPNANINGVDSIRSPSLRLIATVLRPGATHGDVTTNSSLILGINLDKSHRTATAGDLEFMVDKRKVRESTYLVFSLSDGKLLWPFPENLKQCALSSDASSKRAREKRSAA